MALSALALCNRALLKLGAAPMAAFGEGSVEADLCGEIYPGLRDALLSAHPWSFATAQRRLPTLVAEPVADFAHAFALPPDFLRALSVGGGARGRGAEYRIAERRIHCDLPELVITYIFRPGESAFPPFFDQALVARLAAELCLPITESTSRAELLARLAEQEFRLAKQVDAQQDMAPRIEDYSLVEARLG